MKKLKWLKSKRIPLWAIKSSYKPQPLTTAPNKSEIKKREKG